MIKLIKGVLILIAFVVGGISAAMTFRYGLIFTDGPERVLFAILFGASDAAKFFMLALGGHLDDIGRRGLAYVVGVVWIFLVVVSASFHVGLVMTSKDHSAGDTLGAKAKYEQAVEERDRFRKRLAELGNPRTVAVIEADIAAKKLDAKWKRSAECKNVTVDDSRDLCRDIERLNAEKTSAGEAGDLRTKLEEAALKVSQATAPAVFQRADAASEQIGAALGLPKEKTLFIIALLIAAIVETCSSLLLHFALAKPAQPKVAKQESGHVEVVIPLESPSPTSGETEAIDVGNVTHADESTQRNFAESEENQEVAPTSSEVLDPVEWLRPRLRHSPGGAVYFDDLLERYERDASEQGLSAANKNAFSRALKPLGFTDRGKNGTRVTIRNANLKPAKLEIVGA